MPKTIKYKDNSGVIQTVGFDSSYPVEVETNADTEWTLKTTDPLGTDTSNWIGRKPKK
jgi:hypothetical protein